MDRRWYELVVALSLFVVSCAKHGTLGPAADAKTREHVVIGTTEETRVPEETARALIERSKQFAIGHGYSIDGLVPSVSDYGDDWMVWFSGPLIRGKSGGEGFVVKIKKSGKVEPTILKFQ